MAPARPVPSLEPRRRRRRAAFRAAAALLAVPLALALLAGARALWLHRERLRHLAVPTLEDPSLPPAPAEALLDAAGCEATPVAALGQRVTALLRAGDGAIWAGTFEGGLFRLAPGELPAAVPGLEGRERFVNALAERDGLVWAATQGGLLALDGERRVLTLLADDGATALARAGRALLAGSPRGLFRASAALGAEPVAVAGPLGEPLRVTALAAGGGELWIGTASGAYALPLAALDAPLLARTARAVPLVFGEPGAETNVVTALAGDAGGAVAGTDDGGLVRLRAVEAPAAVRFGDARALAVNAGAAATGAGGLAFGTQGGGLLLVSADGGALAVLRAAGAAGAGADVSAVAPDGEGWLAATSSGAVLAVRCVASDGALAAAGTPWQAQRP
jgi:ligand-binding sensor domain-containing protein